MAPDPAGNPRPVPAGAPASLPRPRRRLDAPQASSVAASTDQPGRRCRGGPDRIAFVACGAITRPAKRAAALHGWPLDIHAVPPAIHNRPHEIASTVERLVDELRGRYGRVIVGFAHCGTYGTLDETCARLGVERLPGLYCYDLYAGTDAFATLLDEEPGTYILTDFLLLAFDRLVVRELGLDRYPELRDDYFGNYTRLVWLAQEPDDPALRRRADAAADRIGLPLEVVPTGYSGLERALAELMAR